MSKIRAAFAAAVLVVGACAPLHAAEPVLSDSTLQALPQREPLLLDDAFERVLNTHPDLAVLRYSRDSADAETDRAALPPPLRINADVENALGTGTAAGVRGVELTVSLASVLERGDKRGARVALALQQRDAVDLLREGRRLDLLAETARRYLDVAAAQGIAAIAREALQQRERMLTATAARVTAGGAPESVQLAAQAAQVRARADIVRAQRAHAVATRRLALLWGGDDGDDGVDAVAGDAARLPSVPALAALEQRLANTPELRRFAHEARLREARLQLARSARVTDLEWQVGVRRLQSDNDWGLVGTLSLPLGSAARAAPGIRAAEAELAALDLEREGEVRTLEATLLTAWHALDTAVADALQVERELLPLLLRAEAAAERAFRAGALSHLEWSQLQTDILVARRERLDAAVAAHRALIELQRLTGDTFTPSAAPLSETTP